MSGRGLGLSTGIALTLGSILAFHAPSLATPARQALPAELEAVLTGATPAAGSIRVLGLNVNVSAITLRTPGGIPLSLADVVGAPLPGRTEPGYIGGTVFATLGSAITATGVNAQAVTLAVPETVLIGPVTANEPGVGPAGRRIAVLGVEIRAAVDPRLDPFQAVVGAFPVDVASIPLGSQAAVEGYFGVDGFFYAQVLDAEQGTAIGGVQVSVGPGRCRQGALEVRGTVSVFSGNVQLLDPAGAVLGTAPVSAIDGTWRFRARLASCPANVRARHVESGVVSAPFTPAAN